MSTGSDERRAAKQAKSRRRGEDRRREGGGGVGWESRTVDGEENGGSDERNGVERNGDEVLSDGLGLQLV